MFRYQPTRVTITLGITVVAQDSPAGLVTLPAMQLARCLVVPHGHELLRIEKPTLSDIARYRFVCYNALHPSGARIRALFKRAGLDPQIATTASDASVIKELVAAGQGVAILHRIALVPEDDARLAVIDVSHVVPFTQTHLILRQGEYLRNYVYDFMEKFAPAWTRRSIMTAISARSAPAAAPALPEAQFIVVPVNNVAGV